MKLLILVVIIFNINLAVSKSLSLDDVISGKVVSQGSRISKARLNFITSLATEYGLYYGRQDYIQKFNSSLNDLSDTLNEINFSYLLIGSNLLPPVVVEADDYLEVMDATHHKNVKKLFRIVADAKLVASVPTWRDYIFVKVEDNPPSLPTDFKLETKEEKQAWKLAAQKGIDAGVLHAKDEIENQYALLIRDYKGMLLAHHLNDLNILSFSKLERLKKGIIVENKMIDIDDVTIVSNENDIFNSSDVWIPLIKDSENKPNIKKDYIFISDSSQNSQGAK